MTTLDLLSEDLDPLVSLYSDDVVLPAPAALPLDNISRARYLLPKDDPNFAERAQVVSKPRGTSRSAATRFTNELDALALSFETGPLSLLRTCCVERGVCRVYIRQLNGLRGVIAGRLKSFDRHFNLLLCDVHEEFRAQEYRQIPVLRHLSADSTAAPSSLVARLKEFYRKHEPNKLGNCQSIAEKYASREGELWDFLHRKYEVKMRREDEWVRKESAKFPGSYFFHSRITGHSCWDAPPGYAVVYKTVARTKLRRRSLKGSVVVRGDCVVAITRDV